MCTRLSHKKPLTAHRHQIWCNPLAYNLLASLWPCCWGKGMYEISLHLCVLQAELTREIAVLLVAKLGPEVAGFAIGWHVADELQVSSGAFAHLACL